jgi:hypothetical protein
LTRSEIVADRKNFIGTSAKGEPAIRHAIQAVALHFTIKILFIKLIEDLARGPHTPRIIHTLFPNRDYDQIGGLFGFKVLNALGRTDRRLSLRLFVRSRNYYKRLAQDLARVSWQDIFRYGFNVQMERYGQLFSARHYDRFLPADTTLQAIRQDLIQIDIRTAIIYGSAADRTNVIGNIYEKLIDKSFVRAWGQFTRLTRPCCSWSILVAMRCNNSVVASLLNPRAVQDIFIVKSIAATSPR